MIIRKYVQIGPLSKTTPIVSYDSGRTWFYDNGEPVDMSQVYEYNTSDSTQVGIFIALICLAAVIGCLFAFCG